MVSIGRRTLVAIGVGLALLSGSSGASLVHVVSRDDLAPERRATLKRGYEEKLKALQAQIDQISSRRSAEHQGLEARLRDLLARQDAFEIRQAVVQDLSEQVGFGHVGLSAPGPASTVEVTSPTSPAHAYAPEQKPKIEDVFQLRLRRQEGTNPERTSGLHRVEDDLKRAADNLERLERRQVRLLGTVIHAAEEEATQLQSAIRGIGLEPDAFVGPVVERTGGPLVPAGEQHGFFKTLATQARESIDRLNSLRRSVAGLPFGEPIDGEIDFSSGFGYRIDPFTRSPALHTGLDFRAEFGALVYAAGAGRVVTAEYSGAYGNMIEIDHGNGVTSRYAHLSAIGVASGQRVDMGTPLGHVGSTGRSTGPHLHYEIRIDGHAVNPRRFLQARAYLTPLVTASR